MKTSRFSGFHKLSVDERLKLVKKFANLTDEEVLILKKEGSLDLNSANKMIENVIGTYQLPFSVATNFLINGKEYLIPMVIEEPSVVAAASFAAKLTRNSGGFKSTSTDPIMIGQIQLVDIEDVDEAKKNIEKEKENIIKYANEVDPAVLVKYGGGLKNIKVRIIKEPKKMLIVHLLVDCRDAMGANAINTLCESIAPKLEELTGGRSILRIISNLAVYRTARAKAVWKKEDLEKSVKTIKMKGEEIVDAIIDAYLLAVNDQFRCTTHNKGIMNGVDAVVIATGNDFRAIESGAHSFAAYGHPYQPLTKYYKNENGDLVGEIEIPTAVGIIGGMTRNHPTAKIGLKILSVKSAKELGEVLAVVGLAQNFAALRALATEGIQRGHMRLHAKNIAIMAGAKAEAVDRIAKQMIKENKIRIDRAKELLEK